MHEMKKKRKEKEKKKTEEGKQYFINLNLVRKLDFITVAFTRVVLFLFCFFVLKTSTKTFFYTASKFCIYLHLLTSHVVLN